ncbi:hypothetical protein LWI29_001041 [Acer saccharum]|uniref:Uncharacterized protein n=1 Tax=Acer saccharum TaxID=4024 RepID=A0AA39SRG3_ACESA|nr:hypothetical protein LWI29_001041 [Acer saccharum]
MKDMKINVYVTPILLKTSINQILKATSMQLHSHVKQPTRRRTESAPCEEARSPGQRRSRQETPPLKWKVEGFSLVQGMWESRFMSVVVAKHLALNQGILYRALAHLSLAWRLDICVRYVDQLS